ncbi:MAG TPA: SBBP repeat-containing protein, partial [Planctomycetota bacterium]|nr:SBBP repeat-containing protein [Planctomycetota bacterium]
MNINSRRLLFGIASLIVVFTLLHNRSKPAPRAEAFVDGTHVGNALPPKGGTTNAASLSPEKRTELANIYHGLPLTFEENIGQTHDSVKFVTRGERYAMFFRSNDVIFSLRNSKSGEAPTNAILRMKLMNAHDSAISGQGETGSHTNYFVGNNPAKYRTNVANYSRVRYGQVYDGVDLVYYGNQNELEYDFVVAPGANPDSIQMSFQGIDKAEIDPDGNLAIRVGDNFLVQHKPVIYQMVGNEKKAISGRYELVHSSDRLKAGLQTNEAIVGFKLGEYDRALPLVIDPELVYATFFGDKPNTSKNKSDHSGDEEGYAIAIDPSGAAYVVGTTTSYEFPLVGALELVADPIDHSANPQDPHIIPGAYRGFITKFAADGKTVVYSTYLSSATGDTQIDPNSSAVTPPAFYKQERCTGIAVDALGNAYICGFTDYASFPIKNALHTYSGNRDAFITKINPAGSDLLFSTYLGGEGNDEANDLAIDNAGNIVVVGRTSSQRFVLAHAIQSTHGGGTYDGFVSKFTTDGSVNIFSTYLGGTGDDSVNGVACDASGNIFLTGSTASTNFPIANPLQPVKAAGSDAFVTKMNPTGSLLVFSTYFGGNNDDVGNGIAVDNTGNVYITGSTFSTDFPTVSPTVLPAQATNGGGAGTSDAFVSKFNVYGNTLIFSTYLGGSMNDAGLRIRVDSRNAIYVAG